MAYLYTIVLTSEGEAETVHLMHAELVSPTLFQEAVALAFAAATAALPGKTTDNPELRAQALTALESRGWRPYQLPRAKAGAVIPLGVDLASADAETSSSVLVRRANAALRGQ